jgi:predicted DNA-binding transcriptional regulator YafY
MDLFDRIYALHHELDRAHQPVSMATLELHLECKRDISPLRLIHYRDNWYLDAWCHQAKALRRFSLDRISAARPMREVARDYDLEELAAHTDNSYGIISGGPIKHAILLFNAGRALDRR